MADADIKQMGTLLSRMTEKTETNPTFNSDQVNSIVEILVPRMITELPGMPKGFKVSVDRDDCGWTIRVDRP